MKDGEELFLRTPEDILPLNAYFKLNQKIRRYALAVISSGNLMVYENRDYILR